MTAFERTGPLQTSLVRSFAAPRPELFTWWTRAHQIAQWWGPRSVTIPECHFDFREGGRYKIVMMVEDGTLFPMYGAISEISSPSTFTLSVLLDEHPKDFIEQFRPAASELSGIDLIWHYTIDFEGDDEMTTVSVVATYPVESDIDTMLRLGGEQGWSESFDKLDELLGI
jgi:uncharacterized protein YndB with AHSA1/START domain